MAEIRPFTEYDLAEVADLCVRVHPDGEWASPAACAACFQEIFFASPWTDAALPSWVAREGGRAVGFIGVLPRPMRHRGTAVSAALVTQLMVEPQQKRHGLAAAQLLRAALSGPQELTFSDGADETSRRMWEACRGANLALYGLQWRRLLRPARCALGMLPGIAGRAAPALGAPMAAAADAYLARRMGLGRRSALVEEVLTGASLLTAIETVGAGYALRPQYDAPKLDWLLLQARAQRRHGELHGQILRQAGGRLAGWFLYYLSRGTSKVLQLAAREGAEETVLAQLFDHAWRRGGAAIEGRMEPRFARALSRQHCFFQAPGRCVVAHAKRAELLAALSAGDSFFTRLEGEGWMRFSGEAPEGARRGALARQRSAAAARLTISAGAA